MEQGAPQDPGTTLTQRQWLIWTEQRLAPELPANNLVMSFEITGRVDPVRFERAFGRVVAESEALRTVIRMVDEQPRRFFRTSFEAPVEHVDLSSSPDPQRAYRRWRDQRCVRRFDLDTGLFDSVLVRLGPGRSVWYLCQHHLICDAWSFGLIFDRTAELYEDPSSPDSRSQVGFVEKQVVSERAYLDSERHAADEAYWRQRFEQPIEPLRPYGLSLAGKGPALRYVKVDLGEHRSAKIRALAADDEVRAATPTLAVSLLFTTALYAYLYRVTGNQVIGIGSPIQNRPSRWSKGAIGRFAETCPLSVHIDFGDSFRSLHARVVEESFEVLSHTRFSLANPFHAKRYDAVLNFHNVSIREFAGLPVESDLRIGLGSLSSDREAGSRQTARDVAARDTWLAGEALAIHVHDFGGRGSFRLGFEFNADVFDEGLRQRAVEHFVNLLDAMLEDPSQRIDCAPMATASEIPSLSRHTARTSDRPPSRTVLARFREHVAANPEHVAVVAGERALSYAELDRSVRRLSATIREAAPVPGALVGVVLGRTPTLLAALLAVHDAGAAFLPIDPEEPAHRIREHLEHAAPALVLVEGSHAGDLPSALRAIRLGPDWASENPPTPPTPEPGRPVETDPHDLAYVVSIPRSDGRPRRVEIEHASLTNLVDSVTHELGLAAGDRMLAATASAADLSSVQLLLPIATGGSVEFADTETSGDPALLARRLEDPAISLMHAPAETWQQLLDVGWSGRSGVRVLSGPEGLSRDLVDALLSGGAEVWSLFGRAETTIWSALERRCAGDERVSIGRPIEGTTLHVLTPTCEPVPLGTPGMLFIGGVGLARPDADAPETIGDEVRENAQVLAFAHSERLHPTGHHARQDTLGGIELLGRQDDEVEIQGFRFLLGEIEAVLRSSDEVSEVIVHVAHEMSPDRRLVAQVVPSKEAGFDVEAVASLLRARLPAFMQPTHWTVLERMPQLQGGEIDRARLQRDWRRSEGSTRSGEAPRDDVEVQIAALWRELLGVPSVSRDDDFFELGGQSLLAVEAVRRLGLLLKQNVKLATFFENSTVSGLRQALATSGIDAPRTLAVELRSGQGDRPLFCIGGVHLYQPLAQAFTKPLPVYGISVSQEIEWIAAVERGEQPTVPSTDKAAKAYIEAIRTRQPNGPYRLAGLSYAGVLAYEIAQQLRREGEEVEALVLLEARLRGVLAGARGRTGRLRLAIRSLLARVGRIWPRAWPTTRRGELRDQLFVEAVIRYEREAQPYPGSALLCRALGHAPEEIEFDPTLGWGDLIRGGLSYSDCEGDHVDLLSPAHAASTAREIERYLERNRSVVPGTGLEPARP